jgi:hypothetical protein
MDHLLHADPPAYGVWVFVYKAGVWVPLFFLSEVGVGLYSPLREERPVCSSGLGPIWRLRMNCSGCDYFTVIKVFVAVVAEEVGTVTNSS